MAKYYFAYGADMDPEDLGLRCEMRRRMRVSFAGARPAVLKGYRLVCNIPSRHRQGGIFNIVPDPKGTVHGVAYELHAGDNLSSQALKEGEGKNYALSPLEVLTADGDKIKALVLRASPTAKKLTPPAEYLDVVISAAKRHGLPRKWTRALEELKS